MIINNPNDEPTVDCLGSLEALKFAFCQGIDVELIDVVIGWSERWVTSDGYRYYDASACNGSFADYDVFTDEAFQGNAYCGFVLPAAPANSFVAGVRTLEFGDVCECKFVSENANCCSTFVEVGF